MVHSFPQGEFSSLNPMRGNIPLAGVHLRALLASVTVLLHGAKTWQLRAGCLEEAHAHAERALAQAREYQERDNQAYALRVFGDIAARCEPPEIAQTAAHYQQALALAEELGMR